MKRSSKTDHKGISPKASYIPWSKPLLIKEDKDAVKEALESNWISGGHYVDTFENELASTLRTRNAITVSNGTTALYLALLAAGVKSGDEVIVPDFTFVAPANMALACGLKLVCADVCPNTFLIDHKKLESLITKRTKVIIVVHLYGNVADMDEILKISRKYNLYVIEDTAEAMFSKYKGQYAGTLGDIGTFSFQATKTITTGEGGCVVTNNSDLAERMRTLRDHGMSKSKRYWHTMVGHNFRLSNLLAALGYSQLRRFKETINKREKIHRTYNEILSRTDLVIPQAYKNYVEPVLWAYALKITKLIDLPFEKSVSKRDKIIEELKEQNIETRPGFYELSCMPTYNLKCHPESKKISSQIISLPTYVGLKDKEIQKVCETLLAKIGKL